MLGEFDHCLASTARGRENLDCGHGRHIGTGGKLEIERCVRHGDVHVHGGRGHGANRREGVIASENRDVFCPNIEDTHSGRTRSSTRCPSPELGEVEPDRIGGGLGHRDLIAEGAGF